MRPISKPKGICNSSRGLQLPASAKGTQKPGNRPTKCPIAGYEDPTARPRSATMPFQGML